MTIHQYTNDLRAKLSEKIAIHHADEAVEEARSHLLDRTEEITNTGIARMEAESAAIREFGSLDEIAHDFVDSYPPKPPFDPARLDGLFIGIAVTWTCLALFIFFSMPPIKGLEAVAQMLVSNAPMLVVPGIFAGLSRVKYRRFRAAKGIFTLANTGFAMTVVGGCTLIVYHFLGLSSSTQQMPLYIGMMCFSCSGYALMRNLNANGRAAKILRNLVVSRR